MNSKIELQNLEGCKRLLKVEVTSEVVNEKFNKVFVEISKQAKIPGFRKGKIPIEVVKNRFMDDAKEEVLRQIIPTSFTDALKEKGIKPLIEPELTIVDVDLDKPLKYEATFDIKPEVKLGKYKRLKIIKKTKKISQEDVDNVLKELQESNASFDVVKDKSLKRGDFAIMDIVLKEGENIIQDRKGIFVEVGDEFISQEVCEKILGMNIDEERDIEFKFPDGYVQKDLAGKNAQAKIVIKEIKERKLPEINDDFAKDLGEADNIGGLKEKIKGQLELMEEKKGKEDLIKQIVDKLLENSVLDTPVSLVNKQVDNMMKNAVSDLEGRKLGKDKIEEYKQKFADEYRVMAEKEIRSFFVLNAISGKEKIEVTDEDLNEYLLRFIPLEEDEAKRQEKLRNLKASLEKQDLIHSYKAKVKEEKILDFILRNAVVKEKAE